MSFLLIVGEDDLCCALGERMAAYSLSGWNLKATSIAVGGVTKLKAKLPRYVQQSRYVQPVFCIADTDGKCPIECLKDLYSDDLGDRMILRLAETEAESWVLADREGFADAFCVSTARVPVDVDSLADPKQVVLTLAAKSKARRIRDEVVSVSDRNKRGSGYNLHLCSFVRTSWNVEVARSTSSSLDRACAALEALRARVNAA